MRRSRVIFYLVGLLVLLVLLPNLLASLILPFSFNGHSSIADFFRASYSLLIWLSLPLLFIAAMATLLFFGLRNQRLRTIDRMLAAIFGIIAVPVHAGMLIMSVWWNLSDDSAIPAPYTLFPTILMHCQLLLSLLLAAYATLLIGRGSPRLRIVFPIYAVALLAPVTYFFEYTPEYVEVGERMLEQWKESQKTAVPGPVAEYATAAEISDSDYEGDSDQAEETVILVSTETHAEVTETPDKTYQVFVCMLVLYAFLRHSRRFRNDPLMSDEDQRGAEESAHAEILEQSPIEP